MVKHENLEWTHDVDKTIGADTSVGACLPDSLDDHDIHTSNIEQTPPLPPRNLLDQRAVGSLKPPKRPSRPQLQSHPTIALSLADVHSAVSHDRIESATTNRTLSRRPSHALLNIGTSAPASDAGETSSVCSATPSSVAASRLESLIGAVPNNQATPAWKALSAQLDAQNPFEQDFAYDSEYSDAFFHEFDALEEVKADGSNQEIVLAAWKAKLKHFLILSSSGKPIWSRHGDDQLISSHIGVIQTLISSYQDAKDQLLSFTAGEARFAILSKGHLHLVAISRLGESDGQLRVQLDALYMQILSTLTLPSMERMFINRPSTDLRRPLQGTESLLDALADGFVRGSPSTLLSALECLRLRKTHRRLVNNSFLKVRAHSLLYGLIVAGGRLVSVLRPKKHSLHPGDLHLIFNMLFEAGGVKAGGGENWIPLCLPGFNKTGYLYMYVSFLDAAQAEHGTPEQLSNRTSARSASENPATSGAHEHQVAMIFISADKEAFFKLRQMRDDLVSQLVANKSMTAINAAVRRGRPCLNDILPKTSLRHFVYKSRGNVQFTMPSYSPNFIGPVAKRRLMNLYHALHAAVHTKTAHLKIQHVVSRTAVGLVWETPLFELYCVAGPDATREQLAVGANKVIEWIRKEEERVFIIGGAVF